MKKIISKILIGVILFTPVTTFALTKNESVFSTLNTDGSLNKITVTNHLSVKTKEELQDESELNDIINVNGTETFTKDGNNIVWKANGKDIYYSGTTEKDLPLDIKINYYLNNEKKSAKELVGQKGDIKIEIIFTNNLKNSVDINGQKEDLYTPFVVMAGTMIDSKNNSDVLITNGKVVETGSKDIAISVVSPGLYESLNIDALSNMNKIEINYTTEKFELNNIYIVATPKLIEKSDIELFDDIDSITSSINTLQSSMNQIDQGAKALSNGTNELYSGVEKLSSNLPSEETNKSNEEKLKNLKSTNQSTVSTLISTNTQLEYQKSQIDEKITEATNKKAYVENQINDVTSKLSSATEAYNTYNNNLSQVNNAVASLQQAKDAGVITEEQEITLATLKGQQNSLNQVVPLLLNQKNALDGTLSALNGTKDSIDATLSLLNQTKESLDTSINANKNLATLISGNNTVVDSSINTINSMRSLSSAMNTLKDGARQINDGASTLSTGISRFNNDGIHALSNYTYKVKKYSNKAEALIDLSNQYRGFAANNSNETIFINKVKAEK